MPLGDTGRIVCPTCGYKDAAFLVVTSGYRDSYRISCPRCRIHERWRTFWKNSVFFGLAPSILTTGVWVAGSSLVRQAWAVPNTPTLVLLLMVVVVTVMLFFRLKMLAERWGERFLPGNSESTSAGAITMALSVCLPLGAILPEWLRPLALLTVVVSALATFPRVIPALIRVISYRKSVVLVLLQLLAATVASIVFSAAQVSWSLLMGPFQLATQPTLGTPEFAVVAVYAVLAALLLKDARLSASYYGGGLNSFVGIVLGGILIVDAGIAVILCVCKGLPIHEQVFAVGILVVAGALGVVCIVTGAWEKSDRFRLRRLKDLLITRIGWNVRVHYISAAIFSLLVVTNLVSGNG